MDFRPGILYCVANMSNPEKARRSSTGPDELNGFRTFYPFIPFYSLSFLFSSFTIYAKSVPLLAVCMQNILPLRASHGSVKKVHLLITPGYSQNIIPYPDYCLKHFVLISWQMTQE